MSRILIIDDDEIFRGMLREMLEAHYDVVEAESSDVGIETFRRRKIDLVITDLFMPPGGGLNVIKWVRTIDRQVGIILVSGMALNNRVEIFRQALEAGASRTLEKPLHRHLLLQTVSDLLEEAGHPQGA